VKRLWATLRCDIRLQWRNGFYYAAAVMAALSILLLGQLPEDDLPRLLPAVIVNNVMFNGFYFVGGLVLLEKGEGSLQAQVITPLRPAEYLAAKILSLTLLSLIENGMIALVLLGSDIAGAWLLIGILGGVCFYTLAGFMAVARYEAINEYLLPSMVIVTVLTLPLLPYFDVGDTLLTASLAYVHPLQSVLLALQAASGITLARWQMAYVVFYSATFMVVSFILAQRTFERFVRQAPADSVGQRSIV
jgi:fluoroquinolone transport system permease protein